MSISSFCISQRKKEQQQLKKLLIFGFAGSAFIHGLFAYAVPYLSVESPQVEKPMELIIVEQPKPQPKKTQIVPKPKPEAKPGSSQPKVIEPKPQPPELKPEPPQPKAPAPRKILTSNLPPVDNTPTVSQPQQAIAPDSNTSTQVATNSSNVGGTGTGTGTGTGDEKATGTGDEEGTGTGTGNGTGTGTGTGDGDEEGIACVSNCEPEYPAELEGAEGSAGVKLTIDPDGNVVGAELTDADDNSQINRQALLAARQMEFSSLPDDNAVSVRVKIDFTVEGSEYDRLAREEQARKEQAAKERQEQETARQQQQQRQVEQAQQEQLEQQRQTRMRQQQQQRQVEVKPKPQLLDNQAAPKPLSAPLEIEADQEQLRKFRERIENYQEK